MAIKTHKDLDVYQDAMDFVVSIYQVTNSFPVEERYGLTSQMRRAAVSIPSNISEGAARRNTKEYIQFLYHSLGSAAEIETQLDLAKRLAFINDVNTLEEKIHSIINRLTAIIKSLQANLKR